MPKITFSNKNNEFYQSLKTSVDEYFETKGIKKTGDWRLYIKTIILVSVAIATYFTIMLVPMSGLLILSLCGLLGYTFACVGFSVMHDANHGSYSTKPLVNDFLGLSMNFMGANAYFWKQKQRI